jgi:LuxR family transcriptional regulator, quorum-sensing system regulator BjaR1
MNKDPASLRQDAFNFIDELERLSDSDSILDALQRVLAPFGFGRVVMSGLTLKPGQVFDDIVLASRWPHEFQAIYSARDYLRISPIVRLAIRSSHPYEWDEATWRKDEDPRAIELMELAAGFDMPRGFVVPIHGPAGAGAFVALSGVNLDMADSNTKPIIHMMALYAFDHVRRLALPKDPGQALPHQSRAGGAGLGGTGQVGVGNRRNPQYRQADGRRARPDRRAQARRGQPHPSRRHRAARPSVRGLARFRVK